jgi:hypothetical protein
MPEATKPETATPAPPPEPTPEQLAMGISRDYAAIIADQQTNNNKIVERAIKVGLQLNYCKTKVPHRNWKASLKTNLAS